MAEALLFGIATEVLKKISSLLGRELSLSWDLERDLKKLHGTMSNIEAVLLDAEKKQAQNSELRVWLGMLKDVFYDAEDVLDEFECVALRRQMMKRHGIPGIRKVRHCFSSSNPVVFSSKMVHKIKEIRERLDDIADDRKKFHLTETHVDVRNVSSKERETDSFLRASDVIGREDDKEKIISFLIQPTAENVSVIPIVGIGGLGKTTLTTMVYNDERVDKHFELKMWVCVSDDFDVTRLMKEIIRSATRENCAELKANETLKRLQEILADEKFLLVLDDVWNENPGKWIDLRSRLLNGVNGSKIIISTRSKTVAEIMGTVSPHFIQGLSHEDCLTLFKKWAFKDEEGENFPNLIQIANDIVGKCKGVPLAVRTLGSLLRTKTEERDWLLIGDSDIWKLDQEEDGIIPVLKLSYDHLPFYLKPCFAFLSLFPKDHNFDGEYMVQHWMAIGLLATSNENEGLEDVGLRYLKELSLRCFIEDFCDYGFYHRFKMHDLIHDLAISVAQGECSVVNFRSQNFDGRVRHFSINDIDFSGEKVPEILVNNSRRVRSIIFPRNKQECTYVSFIKTCISKFKYLRLLYLNSILFEVLPNSVGTLIHLRILDLSGNYVLKKLPESLCQLQNLQTLSLLGCIGLKKLPHNVRKMTCLRYLEITTQQRHLSENEIGCLNSLQYLYLFQCSNLVSLFEKMPGLKGLRVVCIQHCNLTSLPHGMKYLTRLEKLLIWSCPRLNLKMELQGEDEDNLRLRLRTFSIFSLPSLVDLPQLILQGSADTLQCMKIENCPKLEALPEWLKNITSLQKLKITSCPGLSSLPEGMQSLSALRELKIGNSPALSESCRRDESKIAHVREIHLD